MWKNCTGPKHFGWIISFCKNESCLKLLDLPRNHVGGAWNGQPDGETHMHAVIWWVAHCSGKARLYWLFCSIVEMKCSKWRNVSCVQQKRQPTDLDFNETELSFLAQQIPWLLNRESFTNTRQIFHRECGAFDVKYSFSNCLNSCFILRKTSTGLLKIDT